MIHKTKKKFVYLFGILALGVLSGFVGRNLDKNQSLFMGVNIAEADLPDDGYGGYETGGCDGGCSGCDSSF